MNRILLLEDDVSLIDGLVYSLKKNEFDVEVARTVCEAKQYLSELDRYDLLILDVTLPDGTGFDVCERVRKENQQIPIIFLTASDEEVSIIRGLDSGGDDYITKPFKLGELCSRIRALLRRAGVSKSEKNTSMECGDITIDLLGSRATLPRYERYRQNKWKTDDFFQYSFVILFRFSLKKDTKSGRKTSCFYYII